ncbi:MAG: hypothetical protein WD716_04415 [Fimbriimonadaceae bacterium]
MQALRHVKRPMRALIPFLLALAALSLVGCSKKPTATKVTAGAPTALDPTKVDPPEIPVDVAIGEVGKGGWKKAPGSLSELGVRMDEAMAVTEPLLATAEIVYDDPSVGKMTMKSKAQIEDTKTFDIEFTSPETAGSWDRIRGDGTKRAIRKAGAWEYLSRFSSSPPAFTEQRLLDWPSEFPEQMFASFIDGTPVWSRLFDAWAKGKGGYKATFEEQTFKRGEESRSHYKVYATTTKGGPTEVEILVDKERLRPLTIRVIGTNAEGKEYKMMWTGKWNVGGTFDAKTFAIPNPLPQTDKAS